MEAYMIVYTILKLCVDVEWAKTYCTVNLGRLALGMAVGKHPLANREP